MELYHSRILFRCFLLTLGLRHKKRRSLLRKVSPFEIGYRFALFGVIELLSLVDWLRGVADAKLAENAAIDLREDDGAMGLRAAKFRELLQRQGGKRVIDRGDG